MREAMQLLRCGESILCSRFFSLLVEVRLTLFLVIRQCGIASCIPTTHSALVHPQA